MCVWLPQPMAHINSRGLKSQPLPSNERAAARSVALLPAEATGWPRTPRARRLWALLSVQMEHPQQLVSEHTRVFFARRSATTARFPTSTGMDPRSDYVYTDKSRASRGRLKNAPAVRPDTKQNAIRVPAWSFSPAATSSGPACVANEKYRALGTQQSGRYQDSNHRISFDTPTTAQWTTAIVAASQDARTSMARVPKYPLENANTATRTHTITAGGSMRDRKTNQAEKRSKPF